ncbi:MAG: hypothetical protein R3310_11905 [Candidatus Competibacteraceae bacterium]|nr:hypothetical protein [Candidatus Competibacteraceae bacterium]
MTDTCSPADLGDKVAFLSHPASYPEGMARVEVRETHTSFLFLGTHWVYKLKKPLREDHLDFSTVEKRHRNARTEVRLNRRLAPAVYQGLVALGLDKGGELHLDGAQDRVADWLVKMRRLDEGQVLETRIRRRRIAAADIRPLAHRLADFYRGLSPVSMTPWVYRERYRRDIEADRRILSSPRLGLPVERVNILTDWLLGFLTGPGGQLLGGRSGRIVEAHGDLRPEHIYLNDQPAIIDCLEFDRELRLLDPVDELGFLALECRRLGAGWIGPLLLEVYRETSGDRPPDNLIRFYMTYRALLWARLAILHLDWQNGQAQRDKWCGRALDYLALAETYSRDAPLG